MKTLDEVIESITKQSGLEIRNIRKADKDRFWVDRETYNDALFYLKEYKTLQYGYIKAIADLEDNPALTWTELQSMVGKPVWIEAGNGSRWIVIESINKHIFANGEYIKATDEGEFEDEDFGEWWQAYRKELE